MAFGNRARSVRAYEYGCLAPTAGEHEAVEAMFRRVKLWNELVALDKDYNQQKENVVAPHMPVGLTASDEDNDRRKAFWDARRLVFKQPEVLAEIRRLEKEEYVQARTISRESGLNWMNYEEVLLAWQQARRRPGDLRFHAASTAHGKITARWQYGLPVAKAFELDTRLQLHPVPTEAYTSPVRGERRRLSRSVVRLRVRSEDRAPVWVELPCVLHRPLPVGGLIRQASLVREPLGLRYRWKLVLIVELPESERPPLPERPTVDLLFGWSKMADDSLRVCRWHDSEGHEGSLVLPARWLSAMSKCEDLQSIRDKLFNGARARLLVWLETHELPDGLRVRAQSLASWRSPRRLGGLVWQWHAARFEGDSVIFEDLEDWRKRERHLYEYQSNQRDQARRERREIYRCFAVRLARSYSTVTMQDLKLSQLARKRGKGQDLPEPVRRLRFLASLSTLRLAVTNACAREGVGVLKAPGKVAVSVPQAAKGEKTLAMPSEV